MAGSEAETFRLPEVIYHGTSEEVLSSILRKGLVPRRMSLRSNWAEHGYESRDDMIYLTTTYPLYFAACAVKDTDWRLLVVEIATDALGTHRLYPDEDFVSQIIAQRSKRSLTEIHPEVRSNLELWQENWTLSLERIGNVCHKGPIAPGAITRYALIDPKVRHNLIFEMLQPAITEANYAVKGNHYRRFVSWVFGDAQELPMVDEARGLAGYEQLFGELTGLDAGARVQFWIDQSKDRTGIDVFQRNRRRPS